jgi:hypothetical protein
MVSLSRSQLLSPVQLGPMIRERPLFAVLSKAALQEISVSGPGRRLTAFPLCGVYYLNTTCVSVYRYGEKKRAFLGFRAN